MALTTKHRSSLYQSLAPIIGEEEAEALLSQFPSRDLDEPVTKEFVRAEIADVRAELVQFRGEVAAEFAQVRAEHASFRGEVAAEFARVRAEHASFRGEVAAEFAQVRAEIARLEARINDRFREQTMWMAGAMTVGMGLAAGIGTLLG